MKFLLLLVLLFYFAHETYAGEQDDVKCTRDFIKLGCFKDSITPSRPLPEMLLNDRDRNSKHNDGHVLNWHRWPESMHSLACRCAEAARKRGYKIFALQFYGECWSGPNSEMTYTRDGVAPNDRCIQNLVKPYQCDERSAKECVGKKNTNYVYRLVDSGKPQTPDVDGGWSQWSHWSQCSKTCGMGTSLRERACSNPVPAGNGMYCQPDADGNAAEENEYCMLQECTFCSQAFDLGIILDSSSSVRKPNFEKVKDFLEKLVDELEVSKVKTHVGVIHYNHNAYVDWNFHNFQNPNALKKEIGKIPYQPGGTRTDKALEAAGIKLFSKEGGQRNYVPHVLMVVTDGKTSSRSKKYEDVLKLLKDVKIVSVGVGHLINEEELTTISKNRKENVFHISKFSELKDRITDIVKSFCKQAVFTDPA